MSQPSVCEREVIPSCRMDKRENQPRLVITCGKLLVLCAQRIHGCDDASAFGMPRSFCLSHVCAHWCLLRQMTQKWSTSTAVAKWSRWLEFPPACGTNLCKPMARTFAQVTPIFLSSSQDYKLQVVTPDRSLSFITVLLPKQDLSVPPTTVTAATHNSTTSAMNEKQPLMESSATSRPSARQTTSAWPLDRHQIWQGLTDKLIWIEAVIGVTTQIICTAWFSSTSLSFAALYNMIFTFVPLYIATKVILKPLLDGFFGRLFGPSFSRRSARQPILPSYRLNLRP
jgi:hypothetical protein